jgi:hypothetical protein
MWYTRLHAWLSLCLLYAPVISGWAIKELIHVRPVGAANNSTNNNANNNREEER